MDSQACIKQLFEATAEALAIAKEKIAQIDVSELPAHITASINEHPYEAAFHVFNGIVLFYPGILSTPFLWGIGCGAKGPRAASIIRNLQAMVGNLPARGIIAYLQSAGMGGYGLGAVNTLTRAGAAVSGAVRVHEWKRHQYPAFKL